MRDFYIYGFKARKDFSAKSARTYDNEKRRCESYLGESMKWAYAGGNKVSFVSADCAKIGANPLFSAWKSKSFTANDIILHFYILDELQKTQKTAETLTEEITQRSGKVFDVQTVRLKCNEYVDLGILTKVKVGKAFKYQLVDNPIMLDEELIDAIKFFQSGNLGVIGSYILDSIDCNNDLFMFKHHYIAHTLEDGILFDILTAIDEHKKIHIELLGSKTQKPVINKVIPMKIICSHSTGRRYLCAYSEWAERFITYRLDAIKSVNVQEHAQNYRQLQDALLRNIDKVWGVSFEGGNRNQTLCITFNIDETHEQYIINRIKKEGRGGVLERVDKNTFKYTKEVFDANETMPWVKTFIGRIVAFDANEMLNKKLNDDICRMAKMYGIDGGAENE